jgi:rod shape-determining protein MreC
MLSFLGRHWRRILMALLLALLAFLLALRAYRRNIPARAKAEQAIQALIVPAGHLSQTIWNLPEKTLRSLRELKRARAENERLRSERDEMRRQLSRLSSVEADNAQLRDLLKLKPVVGKSARLAHIALRDPSTWHSSFLIDLGSEDACAPGSPVVTSQGIVGRVTQVFPKRSRALLVLAPSSSVAVADLRSNVHGVVTGTGHQSLKFQFVAAGSDVETGDMLVSSGTGGVFPRGIPVGTVIRKSLATNGLMMDIDVTPVVDFGSVEYVYVLPPEEWRP